MRMVVLLCGPAGAGKTTIAHQSGLTVYDRDDPQWSSERQFTAALRQLAYDPTAQAVVIRAGASSSARAKAAAMMQATHTYLITEDPTTLGHRVASRNRADKRQGLASIKTWWDRHDTADGVPTFPGWPVVHATPPTTPPPMPVRMARASTTSRGYGARHQQLRAGYKRRMAHGEQFTCWRCGELVDPQQPWDLGHDDHDRSSYKGPEHRGRECSQGGNRATSGRGKTKRWTL
jgi:hypothetical protein